ncbi:hypothetical protein CVT25_007759 [Psilocybe cyanescens]|uniref:Uncharacterized protein n=1 Tax=Psilocybe cyanescens TaxID=93625 RepID=A0A409XHX8_PSICY|nr:hypothetical protein CVT25_007759 [Psilocybe cyanescens]
MSRSSIPEDPPSDSEASWERVSNAGSTPTRAGSPRPSVMTDDHDQPSRRGSDYELKPGIYYIENDQNRDMVIDLSGYDFITILGPGYSIKSVLKGTYITLQTGAIEGASLIASPFPVSWELEADEYESGLWRIRWPRSNFVFDLPNINANAVSLRSSYPFKPTRLWRLVEVQPMRPRVDNNILEFTTHSPRTLEAKPAVLSTADTIVDVEGLKLGGNGEMSITTTTTTVTTSVTTVKRLGVA